MDFGGVCILLAVVDLYCYSIIAQLLATYAHEVLHSGEPLDCLNAICDARTRIGVVVTNIQRIEGQMASDILRHIDRQLHLPIFCMSPNSERIRLTGNGGFIAYILNPMRYEKLVSFWNNSKIKTYEISKAIVVSSTWRNMASSSSSSVHPAPENEVSSSSNPSGPFKWTEYRDRRLLSAIHSLHPDNRKPKQILELMKDVQGLDRKIIGSRLQKYDKFAKKQQIMKGFGGTDEKAKKKQKVLDKSEQASTSAPVGVYRGPTLESHRLNAPVAPVGVYTGLASESLRLALIRRGFLIDLNVPAEEEEGNDKEKEKEKFMHPNHGTF